MELEQQVEAGQAALGRLIRQFFAVNSFKHVQFMQMAHALTGVRWLHSSQISTLKRGATKNLTGFPLYSVAAVNRRIYDISQGTATHPPGTRAADWAEKKPILRPDGSPIDVGDFWRVYFGEMEPPYFTDRLIIEVDDKLALNVSKQVSAMCQEVAEREQIGLLELLPRFLEAYDCRDAAEERLIKGLVVGVIDLDAEQLTSMANGLAQGLQVITGKPWSEEAIFELALIED